LLIAIDANNRNLRLKTNDNFNRTGAHCRVFSNVAATARKAQCLFDRAMPAGIAPRRTSGDRALR
jgi:hypothetical protein